MGVDVKQNGVAGQLVLVQASPDGQFSAQVVGLPELHATASSQEEVIQSIRVKLSEWLAAGRLVFVEPQGAAMLAGKTDPNDRLEKEYLADLQHFRQEDLEATLRAYDNECSSSSSTPTT